MTLKIVDDNSKFKPVAILFEYDSTPLNGVCLFDETQHYFLYIDDSDITGRKERVYGIYELPMILISQILVACDEEQITDEFVEELVKGQESGILKGLYIPDENTVWPRSNNGLVS